MNDSDVIFEGDNKISLIKEGDQLIPSNDPNYPASGLGYNRMYHSQFFKNPILKEYEKKKYIYLVVNNNEIELDDDRYSIMNHAIKKFGLTSERISRDFFKIYEMMSRLGYKGNISVNVIENKKRKDDIISGFVKYGIKVSEDSKKYDTLVINISTTNSGYVQEQLHLPRILQYVDKINEIKDSGMLILKMYECFTINSYIFLGMLMEIFDTVKIMRLSISRHSNPERYVICQGKKKSKKLLQLDTQGAKYIDSMPHRIKNFKFDTSIVWQNIDIANNMYKNHGEVIKYLNMMNFKGMEFSTYRIKQNEFTNSWIHKYFGDKI